MLTSRAIAAAAIEVRDEQRALRNSSATVDGGSAGRRYEAAVAPSADELHAFVSLYNREAVFEVGGSVQAQEYPR